MEGGKYIVVRPCQIPPLAAASPQSFSPQSWAGKLAGSFLRRPHCELGGLCRCKGICMCTHPPACVHVIFHYGRIPDLWLPVFNLMNCWLFLFWKNTYFNNFLTILLGRWMPREKKNYIKIGAQEKLLFWLRCNCGFVSLIQKLQDSPFKFLLSNRKNGTLAFCIS